MPTSWVPEFSALGVFEAVSVRADTHVVFCSPPAPPGNLDILLTCSFTPHCDVSPSHPWPAIRLTRSHGIRVKFQFYHILAVKS